MELCYRAKLFMLITDGYLVQQTFIRHANQRRSRFRVSRVRTTDKCLFVIALGKARRILQGESPCREKRS